MFTEISSYEKIQKLICLVADNQKFAKRKDKLTALTEKHLAHMSEELSEEDLFYATAAKMPDVSIIKTLKDM